MREFIHKWVIPIVGGVLLGLVVGIALRFAERLNGNGQEVTIKTRVDTLVVRDTIVQFEPLFVEKKVVKIDTVAVTDTLTLRDTLFVFLEREQIRWEDSLAVVYASGINPQVDSVIHYTNDRIITIETVKTIKEKARWGLGIQAGAGLSSQGFVPYVGLGVNYNILSW